MERKRNEGMASGRERRGAIAYVTAIVKEKEAFILAGSEVSGTWEKLYEGKGRGCHIVILYFKMY